MWLKKRTSSMQFDLNTVQTLYFKHMEGMKKKKSNQREGNYFYIKTKLYFNLKHMEDMEKKKQSTQKNYFYMKTKFSFCNWKDWVQSAN